MKRLIFLLLIGPWCGQLLLGQSLDSLRALLVSQEIVDTQFVMSLNTLATQRWGSDPDTAQAWLLAAARYADEIGYTKGQAITYSKLGYAYGEQEQFEQAKKYYQQALKHYQTLGAFPEQTDIYNALGRIYDETDDYYQAIEAYLEAQSLAVQYEQTQKLAVIRGNLGAVYAKTGEIEKARDLYQQSISDYERAGLPQENANNYINLGNINQKNNDLSQAADYYQKALAIFEQKKDLRGQGFAYANLGSIALLRENLSEALGLYRKSVDIFQQINYQRGLAMSQTQIGISLLLLQRYAQAEQQLLEGLAVAERVGAKEILKDAHYYLSQCYEAQGQHQKALQYFHRFHRIRFELMDREKIKAINELDTRYRIAQKEQEYQVRQEQAQQMHQAQIEQKLSLIALGTFIIIVLFIGGVLLFFNRQENIKIKEAVMQQHSQIKAQHQDLSYKNNLIQSSLSAARMIQEAILPPPEKMAQYFDDHFVLSLPKDVVSGDFYWAGKVPGTCYLAAVDCTGHGVPGAFMSMIGNTLLDKIILLQRVSDPGQILERLHEEVSQALHQKENGENSGMDISLVAIQETQAERVQVQFAGAKRPLAYYTPQKEWGLISGDRRLIGGDRPVKMPFTTHTLDLPKGSILYLFSDGFADQHNHERRKFTTKALLQLLQQIAPKLPLQKQQAALHSAFALHQGKEEQRDDVLVVACMI
ncbi:MAG: tetratricopeptide repeat protein [Bernardetiaceae bacterium]